MAVHRRTYRAYAGALMPDWSRLLVIPRFAWAGIFQQRLVTIFFVMCFFVPLAGAIAIYLNNNLAFLGQYMQVPKSGLFEVGGTFFLAYLRIQATFAFLFATFVGPGLVSPDLVNGGLPLYFCRPMSRAEYVLGKIIVLVGLLSLITWIPGLFLFGLQGALAGWDWIASNLRLAVAVFFGSLVWIGLISVLALALSAWVRWKIIAGALMLVVLSLFAGLGEAVNRAMRTRAATVLDVSADMESIWNSMLGLDRLVNVPVENAVGALVAMTAVCIWMLAQKVRAYEVVK